MFYISLENTVQTQPPSAEGNPEILKIPELACGELRTDPWSPGIAPATILNFTGVRGSETVTTEETAT